MKKKTILTGDRPTGKLHLGHYVGSLKSRLELQDSHEQYVMLADVQALTDNFDDPQRVIRHVYEVAKDYLAIGLDPSKTTFFIQSQVPEIAELTIYYLNLVTLGRLERNPTVKTEIRQKQFGESIPTGFLCYPISQAADISIFQADTVPVGDDQAPMVELTNEIVRKFNRIYNTNCLKECEIYLSHAPRLVGIDGKGKASKSLGNVIYLSEEAEELRKKVFQMYTDPDHVNINDPGKVEGNVVFTYLDAFHPDQEEVASLKAHYKKGGLGDVRLKKILYNTLQDLVTPMRARRAEISDSEVKEVLQEGTRKARATAQATMEKVRDAIGINYFK